MVHVELDDHLRGMARRSGVDFFGVGDLSVARDAILDQGGSVIASFPRAISIGIALLHPIVDQLPQRFEPAVAMNYKYHAYSLVNQRLDSITSRLSSVVQGRGFRALPVPASQTVDSERLLGAFSHKMAAHLAGLGWIGKSCLLVTPEAGPRVRWATILTGAEIDVTGPPIRERCGKCEKCVDICPPHTFTGRSFVSSEPRAMRFDVSRCKAYHDEAKESMGVAVCGLCLYICPHGRPKTPKERNDE